jgi:hypothetical protein
MVYRLRGFRRILFPRRGAFWLLAILSFATWAAVAGAETPAGPELAFSTYFGGHSTDRVDAVAVDARGEVYIAGLTLSSSLPGGATRRAVYPDHQDGFVSRIDPRNRKVVFTTLIKGSDFDAVEDVAVAEDGSVFIVGSTLSPDFPGIPGVPVPRALGEDDAFMARLDAAGRVVWVRRYGGNGRDRLSSVVIGADGIPWIAGQFHSSDFAGPLRGPVPKDPYRVLDPVVGRVDPATGALLWVRRIGGSGHEFITGLALDAFGNAYVTGGTTSWDLETTEEAPQPEYGGQGSNNLGDAWVGKVAQDGRLLYLTYAGGPGDEYALDIAVSRDGHAYITGFTYSRYFPVINARQPFHAGELYDAFLVKVAPDGRSFPFSTYFGGSSNDDGYGIAVDIFGEVLVTGQTHSDDLPMVGAFQPQRHVNPADWESGWHPDAFLTRFSADGEILSSTYLGGERMDYGGKVAVELWGRAWVSGSTTSARFPLVGPVQGAHSDTTWYDGFVAAIDERRREMPALSLGGGRFRVEAAWFDPYNGRSGVGQPASLTADTGTFWFFRPENVEVVVKVLDGRPVNGQFWVFYGGLSTVEYWLRVTDLVTGAVHTYHNPAFVQASRGDTAALPGEGDAAAVAAAGSEEAGEGAAEAPNSEASSSVGELGGGRFEVTVDWMSIAPLISPLVGHQNSPPPGCRTEAQGGASALRVRSTTAGPGGGGVEDGRRPAGAPPPPGPSRSVAVITIARSARGPRR